MSTHDSKDIIDLGALSMCMSSTAHNFGEVMLLGEDTIIRKDWEDRSCLWWLSHGLVLATKVDTRFLSETSLQIP